MPRGGKGQKERGQILPDEHNLDCRSVEKDEEGGEGAVVPDQATALLLTDKKTVGIVWREE